MSRGKRISKDVIRLIAQSAIDNPTVDRLLLAKRLRREIKLVGKTPPTEETLIKMISRYRNQDKDDLDSPWTLAESVKRNFPSESTPALLKAWKYCLALDIPFTIRKAKWAAYLNTFIKNTADLVHFAHYYAVCERAYQLLNENFNSSDIDSILTMSMCEYVSIVLLGESCPIPIHGGGVLLSPTIVSCLEDAYEASRRAESNALTTLRLRDSTFDDAIKQSDNDWDVLTSIKELNYTEDLVWIYTYWLTTLTKGPEWQKKQREQVIDNIKQLREWITQLPEKKSNLGKHFIELAKSEPPIESTEAVLFELMPVQLLKQAGYFANDSLDAAPGNWKKLINRIDDFNAKAEKYLKRKNKKKRLNNKRRGTNEGTHN